MKIAAILVLFALASCYAKTIESICTQGPEVYCTTEENAALCQKIEFCAGYNDPGVRVIPISQSLPEPSGGQWYWWG